MPKLRLRLPLSSSHRSVPLRAPVMALAVPCAHASVIGVSVCLSASVSREFSYVWCGTGRCHAEFDLARTVGWRARSMGQVGKRKTGQNLMYQSQRLWVVTPVGSHLLPL